MIVLQWVLSWGLPALAAALVWVGVAGPRCTALAIATAVVVPYVMAVGWPPWPWIRADVWLVWGAAVGGVFGTAQDLRLVPRGLAGWVDAALVGLLPWLLLAGKRAGWDFEMALQHLAVSWAATGSAWLSMRSAFINRPGVVVPMAGALCLLGDAVVVRHTPMLWWVAAAAGLALLGAAATALWRRPFVCGAGAALAVALVHGGVLVEARYFGRLDVVPALLAALAPVPMGLAMRVPVGRGWSLADGARTSFGLLASAAMIAAAVVPGRW